MPLSMAREVFITCAVTGAGDTAGRSDKVPVTPAEIADAAIEAAKAGAAVAHIHVRDPKTGKGARDPKLYREVVDRIRSSGTDVVINLTAGMGGDLVLGSAEQPLPPAAGATDMAGATERLAHVSELLPEICTLDCGTMNFGEGDYVMTNTPAMLKAMAAQHQDARRPAGDRNLRHRPTVVGQVAVRAGPDRGTGAPAALHGHPLGRARRHRHADGARRRRAEGLDLLGVLDRAEPASLCGDGGARRRQRPRRAGRQSVARKRAARDEWRPRRAGRADRDRHGRARAFA